MNELTGYGMKFNNGQSVCLILSTPVKSMDKQNK